MESPPPVPPKDGSYTASINIDNMLAAPPSGSKRKREAQDDTIYDYHNGHLEAADPDAHTPKRGRSHFDPSDVEFSDDATPRTQRYLRRKKKVGNLSTLSLRHAAERQQEESNQARGSKFQEGSLTDKPSAQPPSVFTRMIRTDSGNIHHVDALMADYHEGLATPRDSVEEAVDQEKALMSQRVNEITAESTKKDEQGGFFRFGRSLAANFRPVALWNKLWNETKEEMIRQNMEEAERKRRQKEEAEARYAEMKQAGQLGLKHVANLNAGMRTSGESAVPRDSGIVLDSARTSIGHKRTVSDGSQLLQPPKEDVSSHSGSDMPETASKTSKTLKSRLHWKRPSVSNLKDGLKRVKSDFNLAAANRESSSSVSPVKTDFDQSALRKSHSRYDLKKQGKLSKRVSNLETKLAQARVELNEALVEASPMPRLNNKYERFTPVSTLKRPKFVPGRLPTLPSERMLNPEQLSFGDDEQSPIDATGEPQPRKGLDLTESMEVDEVKDDTLKASRERAYPPHVSSIFKLSNDNIEQLPPTVDQPDQNDPNETSERTQLASDSAKMDPNSISNFTSNGAPEPAKSGDYASLDAKLKALDANVKVAKKASKPKTKKRKSGVDDDDKTFKPGKDTDDDAEWKEVNGTPKKKRKSTGNNSSSPPTKKTRGAAGKQSSPQGKKMSKASPGDKARSDKNPVKKSVEEQYSEDEMEDVEAGADDLGDSAPARNSMDSQGLPLEPVYEDEEETSTVPLKDEPSKPTAMATPARYGRRAARSRSRSASPNKLSGFVRPGAEEQMITRAAEAAQQHPGRRGRSASPPPTNGHYKVTETVIETVSVVPGEDGVPKMPKGAHGSFESTVTTTHEGAEVETITKEIKSGSKEDFEWPEDVF